MKKPETKLFIEEKKEKQTVIKNIPEVSPEEKPQQKSPQIQQTPTTVLSGNPIEIQTANPGLGALKKIREQMQNRKQEQQAVEMLSDDRIREAWDLYLQKLLENNQVTSHSNLRMADLKLIDDQVFEVVAYSRIQFQFIENERTGLLIHLQDFFRNTGVQFKVVLDPSAETESPKAEQSMSMRDQYLKMVELYPLIRELRDQLKLDLDY